MKPPGPRPAPGRWSVAALVAAACVIGCAPHGHAAAGNDRISARLTLDNDHFNFWQPPGWRPDFGYTHGTELALSIPHAARAVARWTPAWLHGGGDGGDAALELRLSQQIYSPWRLPPDRPYAGWLGASIGLARATARSRREALVLLGVTGPPSLAGAVQRSLHARFDHGSPPDWSNQLPFEPGAGIEASGAEVLLARGSVAGPGLAVGLAIRGRLATQAVDLRVGLPLVAGWSIPGLRLGMAGTRRGASLHVRLEPKVDLVARDEFLDGTLFRAHPGPGARSVVGESTVAIGLGWGPASVEWTVRRRSREFDGQPRPHTYSSLGLAWQP